MATHKQVGFRPPEEVRIGLAQLAERQGRSMNSELVIAARERLEREFGKDWKSVIRENSSQKIV